MKYVFYAGILLFLISCFSPFFLSAHPMFAQGGHGREKSQKKQDSSMIGKRARSSSLNPLRILGIKPIVPKESVSSEPLYPREQEQASLSLLTRSKSSSRLGSISLSRSDPENVLDRALAALPSCLSQADSFPWFFKKGSSQKEIPSSLALRQGRAVRRGPSLDDLVNSAKGVIFLDERILDAGKVSEGEAWGRPPQEPTPRFVGMPAFPAALTKPKLCVFIPSQDPDHSLEQHMEEIATQDKINCLMFKKNTYQFLDDETVEKVLKAFFQLSRERDIMVVEFGVSPLVTDAAFLTLSKWDHLRQLNIYKASLYLDTLCVLCEQLSGLTHLNIRALECPELMSNCKKYYRNLLEALKLLRHLQELDMSYIQGLRPLFRADSNFKRFQFINKELRSIMTAAPLKRIAAEGWPLEQETFLLFFLKKDWVSIAVGPVNVCPDFFEKYAFKGFFQSLSLDQTQSQEDAPWGFYLQLVNLKNAVPGLTLLRLRHPRRLQDFEAQALRNQGMNLSLSDTDDPLYPDPHATWGYKGDSFDL